MNTPHSRKDFVREELNARLRSEAITTEPFIPETDPENQTVQQSDYDYFFALQGSVGLGPDADPKARMDYREYARILWQERVDSDGDFSSPAFLQFEKDLISGLHNIDMGELVYGDIKANIDLLVATLEPVIRKAILWTNGDVSATGYQVLKVRQSGIILATRLAMMDALGVEKGKSEFGRRTEYMVEDDKMGRLRAYFKEMKADGRKPVKVAVVEDSRKNIDKVQALLDEIFGLNRVAFEGIWAAYSREGLAYKKSFEDGEISADDYSRELWCYNAINEFSELSNPQMLKRLQDAELLIDFDGVIGDNVRMRNVQAQVTYAALQKGKEAFALSK